MFPEYATPSLMHRLNDIVHSNHSQPLLTPDTKQQQTSTLCHELRQMTLTHHRFQNTPPQQPQQQTPPQPPMSPLFHQLTRHRHSETSYPPTPSFLDAAEKPLYDRLLRQLHSARFLDDMRFSSRIAGLRREQQFILTQQRWANHMKGAAETVRRCAFISGKSKERAVATKRDALRLSVGEYVESPVTGKLYLNLGEAAQTLQGFVYLAVEYDDSFIAEALSSALASKPCFPPLVARLSANPRIALKFYDRQSVDGGVSVSGQRVTERAKTEMALTLSVHEAAVSDPALSRPLFPWLPPPHKNVVRCLEHWESPQLGAEGAYFMAMEYANCGELLAAIDALHSAMNHEKRSVVRRLHDIEDASARSASIVAYRRSLALRGEGEGLYIELIRFLFQQMVQAVSTLHNQGVAHCDVSLENFVLHFDGDGQLLVQLIDFGRAQRMERRAGAHSDGERESEAPWPYEAYDFSVSAFPGKQRYSSPEGALFLQYPDAAAYDASKEDVFALAVSLYVMLTATMPWNTPFFLEPDPADPERFGFLNGSRRHRIDVRTMRDTERGTLIDDQLIDRNFALFTSAEGVARTVHANCAHDYLTADALDLLCRVFESRISLKEMAAHRFVATPPNPVLLSQAIHQYAALKRAESIERQRDRMHTAQTMAAMDDNLLPMKAALLVMGQRAPTEEPANDEERAPAVNGSTESFGRNFSQFSASELRHHEVSTAEVNPREISYGSDTASVSAVHCS